MTTDTKAVARYDYEDQRMHLDPDGYYMRYTDHEWVVRDLEEDAARFKKFYEEAIDKLAEVATARQEAVTALAASRAEVERLNLIIRGKSGSYGFAEAVASEGFENV